MCLNVVHVLIAPCVFAITAALKHGVQPGYNWTSHFDSTAELSPGQEAVGGLGLGMMNHVGVTRYKHRSIEVVKGQADSYWGDPGNSDGTRFKGAADLSENVTWGWHHPNGVYNTIPVGAPLIDVDMNIYLGTDDAIRKFSASGDLIWKYAPRGQLAAAPTLLTASTRRVGAPTVRQQPMMDPEEIALRPDWTDEMLRPDDALRFGLKTREAVKKVGVGDRLEVKPGMEYRVGSKEFYRAGDIGEITKIDTSEDGKQRAMIHWPRTKHSSVARLSVLGKRFKRISSESTTLPSMLLATTTSGFVFAIDIATGEEIWTTQACEQIAGVKGSISGSNGIVLAATNRCVDHLCYRYRNQTNPFTPGNNMVRAFMAMDGSELWHFEPTSPVWNFVPQYGKDGDTVMFSDYEGTVYCLDLMTGALKWQYDGVMGTNVQSHALYFKEDDMIFAMGVNPYEDKNCNPFPAPGILVPCNTYAGTRGWLHALNASSGRLRWQYDLDEPPASAGLGAMHADKGTRLIVTTGHNCIANSPSQILAFDPNGHFRWKKAGPTLYTEQCAGDKEGGDVRRAMGGRAACYPGAWSAPVMDMYGDLYIGSQVGELQRWGTPDNIYGSRNVQLLSTLTTGVAFQDQAISFAPGMMAVATCTSLIIFQTSADAPTVLEDDENFGPGNPYHDEPWRPGDEPSGLTVGWDSY